MKRHCGNLFDESNFDKLHVRKRDELKDFVLK